jgi:hypothetical protein
MFPNANPIYSFENASCVIVSEKLPEDCFTEEVDVVSCKEFSVDSFLKTSRKLFTITVNPEKRKCSTGKMSVVGLVDIEKWFSNKLAELGCTLSHFNIGKFGYDKFHKAEGTLITKGFYELNGILNIEDSEKFKEMYCKGIGKSSGKCFGYGFLKLL